MTLLSPPCATFVFPYDLSLSWPGLGLAAFLAEPPPVCGSVELIAREGKAQEGEGPGPGRGSGMASALDADTNRNLMRTRNDRGEPRTSWLFLVGLAITRLFINRSGRSAAGVAA